MKLGNCVLGYSIMAVILHCLFIAYVILEVELDCIPDSRVRTIEQYDVAHFIAWGILYFPFLLVCAFYVGFLKMIRSICCKCWSCCGRNVDGNGATRCKICLDGVFGNPLLFAVVYTLWGVYEWLEFSACGYQLYYGFGVDVVVMSFSLFLMCVWYFISTKQKFNTKQKEHIAQNYNAQLAAVDDGRAHHDRPVGREMMQQEGMEGAGSSPRAHVAGGAPQYAQSDIHVGPYQKAPSKSRPSSSSRGPVYAASAHGVGPYKPQYNPEPPGVQRIESGIDIEISVDLDDEEADVVGTHHTRGPSISFPSKFKGHARRVSSGILDILQKIEAEPECAICMDDLQKGDEMGQLECGHAFHKQCIVEWLEEHTECPMCRKDMTRGN